MQVIDTQYSAELQAPSPRNTVARVATYIATGALAIVGIVYIGVLLSIPFICDHYGECLFGVLAIGGFYGGIAIGIIFAIYATVLLISLCVTRCSQKPEIIYVHQSEYDNGNFSQPASVQSFSSSKPQDFLPPSRFYTASRIVMYIYLASLGLIGLCFIGLMIYAVLACGFDFDCIWLSALFYYIYIFGYVITIDTAIFAPLASFLFLISKCARRPEIIYVKQSEFDQTYGVSQPLQSFGEHGYGATPVNDKGYVLV
eukprot:TRINITY_DN1568_c0_g1_i9.p2 TRINITY_DN1568_c0_g1~~TRINITY_DN1568_c0_g1_i9.p2  ORF type:complete len:267 (-),score=91.98 TRINITY_DN1568_c0_g1_i9:85-855(-)